MSKKLGSDKLEKINKTAKLARGRASFEQKRRPNSLVIEQTEWMQVYILSQHYVVLICSNLISIPDANSNFVELHWSLVHSVLMSNECIVILPEIYTVTCGCKKKCIGRCHCSKFFCIKQLHSWQTYNRQEQKQKKQKKLNNIKTFPYCFDSGNKAYKHIYKITIVWNKISNH